MDELLEQYAKTFGEGFPMIPLAWGRTEEEIMALIQKCLDSKKDAYELGLVQEDDDLQY